MSLTSLRSSDGYRSTLFIFTTCLLLQAVQTLHPTFILDETLQTSDFTSWHTFIRGLACLITYQFGHAGWSHLVGNFLFGLPFMAYLEKKMGSDKFLLYYLVCGVASALLFMIMSGPEAAIIGSSGAIFGVMTGACMVFGDNWKEHAVSTAFFVAQLVPQLMLAPFSGLFGVAFYGHIGGGIGGLLALLVGRRVFFSR